MPYPAKTDPETIVEAARGLIERDGVEQLSLGMLANELGIKPPSLYRHVDSKAALLRAVNERTSYDAALRKAGGSPDEKLQAIFRAHRKFARANPATYLQAFASSTPGQRGDEQMLVQLVLPVQAIMAVITGEENSLAALRGALALVHGFVSLELNHQFQRGGDVTEAFEAAIDAFLLGWREKAKRKR
jgi:AcrR family transcriptional regulator